MKSVSIVRSGYLLDEPRVARGHAVFAERLLLSFFARYQHDPLTVLFQRFAFEDGARLP
jgi:hypothetical protein